MLSTVSTPQTTATAIIAGSALALLIVAAAPCTPKLAAGGVA
jgi:hypothetical protein